MVRHTFFPSSKLLISTMMIVAIYICSILLLSTSNLHITAVEFVKTHHVKTLLENYMNLNDNQLRSILTPGFPLHRFRLAVSDLKNSFEAIESKISPYFDLIKKPLPSSSSSVSASTTDEHFSQQESIASTVTTMIQHNNNDNKEDLLWKWISLHSGNADGIKLKPIKAFGRGIVATENILKGEEVAVIDRKCIMRASLTIETSKNCKKLYEGWTKDGSKNVMKHKSHQTVDKALLSVFLLEEKAKGKSSFFYPYINMLPAKVDYVPVTWNTNEIEHWFQGSFMVPAIASRRNDLHNEYHEGVLSILPELRYRQGFTFEDYLWARVIVATRAFRVFINGQLDDMEEKTMSANSQIVLVPIADLLNHKKRPQTEWTFNVELNAFTLTATKAITIDSPIYDSYGDKSNFEFLLNFGFTTYDGKKNIHFTITKDDLQLADRPVWANEINNGIASVSSNNQQNTRTRGRTSIINLAEGGGGKSINVVDKPYLKKYLLLDSIDRPFLALVAYLRKEGELHEIWKDSTGEFAMTIISKKLVMMKESYATTLDQDKHIYETMDFSTQGLLESNPYKKYVHALKLRMQEKRIIQKLIDLCEKNTRFMKYFPKVNIVIVQDHPTVNGQVIVPTDLVHSIDRNGDLRVGSEVIARWKGGTKYYEASISQVNDEDNTYNLYYWDGDVEFNVPKKRIAWLYDCHVRRRNIRQKINSIIKKRLENYLHYDDTIENDNNINNNNGDDHDENVANREEDNGTGLLIKSLQKTCYQYRPKNDYWAYEYCPGKHVIQFHEEQEVANGDKGTIKRTQTIQLGLYDKRNSRMNGDGHLANSDAYEEWYTNGDGGRVTTIQYICLPSSDDMIRISTKALFHDNIFLAKQEQVVGIDNDNFNEENNVVTTITVHAEHVLDSNKYMIYIKPHLTVHDLKAKIFHAFFIGNPDHTKMINVIYNGEVLSSDRIIEDVGIIEDSHVFFALEDKNEDTEIYFPDIEEVDEDIHTEGGNTDGKATLPKLFHDRDNKIVNITEPAALTYVISFLTPLACVKDDFKEKYLTEEDEVLNFVNDPSVSGVGIGDFCYAYTRRNNKGVPEYNSGHITNINSDGTLSVQYDNGRFAKRVMAQNVLVFDQED